MQSFKKGMSTLEEIHENNYNEILPVFIYENEEEISQISSQMDRTLKKCSKVVAFHSITVKPESKRGFVTEKRKEFYNQKEFNKWMDETYLLTGKAHFYKHDFFLAIETFRFMQGEFKNLPTLYEARLWQARAHIQLREFRTANMVMEELRSNALLPEELQVPLQATYADFYIKQNEYQKALEPLTYISKNANEKSKRIRYTYIRAQLNEELGNLSKASQLYEEVMKMNPPYELVFNASINSALSYDPANQDAEQLLNELEKMLKDVKNYDYRDQIYYAIGKIHQKDGREDKALEYFHLSAEYHVDNPGQLAETHLTMADMYYKHREYMDAQVYYDSALYNLPETKENYNLIRAKATSLSRLAEHSKTYELQDSLLALSNMSDPQLMTKIDQIIEQVIEEEARQREEERIRQEQMMMSRLSGGQKSFMDEASAGKWYFYNLTAKSKGQAEFRLKWGNRELEDNWRRKNKNEIQDEGFMTEEDPLAEGDTAKKELSNKSREYYLQDIPQTDSAKAVARKKVESALYEMGMIYQNELEDYPLAIEAYQNLSERFPDGPYAVSAYYHLYKCYQSTGNDLMVDFYKNKIITDFPESLHAKLLKNPEYIKEIEKEARKSKDYYQATYDAFEVGRMNEVHQRVAYARENFNEEDLMAKFEYLDLMARAKNMEKPLLRDQLKAYIETYPDNELADKAQTLIALMDEKRPELVEREEAKIAEEIYNFNPATTHYVGFYNRRSRREVNQLVFNLINFNIDHYEKINLSANAEQISKEESLVLVKSFKNSKEARNYIDAALRNEGVFKDVDMTATSGFVITQQNLNKLKEDKSVERYISFFNNRY